jgi:hypothetical protein
MPSLAAARSILLLVSMGAWAALSGVACSGGSGGAEHDDEVVLIVGEGVPEAASSLAERALSEEVRFSEPEPLFRVERVPADRFEGVRKRRTIVMLANLNVPGHIARVAREVLSEEQLSNASSHHGSISALEGTWAPGQLVVVLASTDATGILSLVEERSARIRDVVQSAAKDRIETALFREGENTDAAEELAASAGWSLRIPKRGWTLDTSRAADRVVALRADSPARVLAVRWTESATVPADPESALVLLDGVGGERTPAARVDRERSKVTEGRFRGERALFVQGAWSAEGSAGGDALQAVLVADPGTSRLYVLEWSARARAGEVKGWMWQLEALANTFRPAT